MWDDCIEWTGSRTKGGYGTARDPLTGRGSTAHRLAYINAHGPIPKGLEVDHLCRNRACVNVEHLEAVTSAENKRRAADARPNYPCGHPRTPENTYEYKSRQCRTCIKARQAAWRAANTEKRRADMQAWQEQNRDKVRAANRAYYQRNKARLNAERVERERRKREAERE